MMRPFCNFRIESDKSKYSYHSFIKCCAPLLKNSPQHHGHKGDSGVTLRTCGAIGKRAQMILVWVKALKRCERLPSTETRSHKG